MVRQRHMILHFRMQIVLIMSTKHHKSLIDLVHVGYRNLHNCVHLFYEECGAQIMGTKRISDSIY